MDAEATARWLADNGYRVRRDVTLGGDDGFVVPLVARRGRRRLAVLVTQGPPAATALKRLASEARQRQWEPALVGPDDPETRGLCQAHGVALYAQDDVAGTGAFLDQFAKDSGTSDARVVGAVYPKVAGQVQDPEDPGTGHRMAMRWTVVVLIWILALLVVGVLFLRAL